MDSLPYTSHQLGHSGVFKIHCKLFPHGERCPHSFDCAGALDGLPFDIIGDRAGFFLPLQKPLGKGGELDAVSVRRLLNLRAFVAPRRNVAADLIKETVGMKGF